MVYHSLGNTVGIITGQMLGAGRSDEEVKDHNRKLTALCTVSGMVFGLVGIALSGIFPDLYNTTESVRLLAARMIIIMSVIMPFPAYIFPVYFTLRAGGKTLSTFLFDCGSVWLLTIPLAYCLSRFTTLPILVIFALCNATLRTLAQVFRQDTWQHQRSFRLYFLHQPLTRHSFYRFLTSRINGQQYCFIQLTQHRSKTIYKIFCTAK